MSIVRKRHSSQGVAHRVWSAWLRFGSPRLVADDLHSRESQDAKRDHPRPPNSIGNDSSEFHMVEEATI